MRVSALITFVFLLGTSALAAPMTPLESRSRHLINKIKDVLSFSSAGELPTTDKLSKRQKFHKLMHPNPRHEEQSAANMDKEENYYYPKTPYTT
ncbi:hypothetical protein IWQ60_000570 [Tieghemiomyces parasiticus]|uniref:Uncharacterized protein n=1 Tax=Tieghemiomyces parasiticus TaxID=78921 RepID=A0A9W8E2N3_9FUNG|nr:hypothetical protein IWQ60_000570 [Tieghemiomyces parasiticus]